jgi:hypothetical protein
MKLSRLGVIRGDHDTDFGRFCVGSPAIRSEALVAVFCRPSRGHDFNAGGDAIVR